MEDGIANYGFPADSLMSPIGYQTSDCGYCKGTDTSQRTPDSRASYYVRSTKLRTNVYQELMDRGWRRSGTLLYLPDASRSCCPHYTIRLPASRFQANRDQRQALHRWNRYVLGEKYLEEVKKKHPKTKAEKKRENNCFDLLTTIHESETANLKPNIEPAHQFQVTLEPDTFTAEKFALFENYQRNVHHEGDGDISRTGFRRFLCDSPIVRQDQSRGSPASNGANGKYGSWHQCYRLDGRLIAMAVLDLLPHAVSGVYFIYHSDFAQYSFGKLSALRETALTLEGGYEYYYMGFYIHSCLKMRYKGEFKPQTVLDLHHSSIVGHDDFDDHDKGENKDDDGPWHPLDQHMRTLMEKRHYVSMIRERVIQGQLQRERTIASQLQRSVEGDSNSSAQEEQQSTSEVNIELDGSSDVEETREEALASKMYPSCIFTAHDLMLSGQSLLVFGMPGIRSESALRQEIDLDELRVTLGARGGGAVYRTSDLVGWKPGTWVMESGSLKSVVADWAAAVGPSVARQSIISFG